MKSAKLLKECQDSLRKRALTPEKRETIARTVGRDLKCARKILKFTQAELAKILDAEQSALSRIENGEQRMDSAQTEIFQILEKECERYEGQTVYDEKEVARIERIRRLIFGEVK